MAGVEHNRTVERNHYTFDPDIVFANDKVPQSCCIAHFLDRSEPPTDHILVVEHLHVCIHLHEDQGMYEQSVTVLSVATLILLVIPATTKSSVSLSKSMASAYVGML